VAGIFGYSDDVIVHVLSRLAGALSPSLSHTHTQCALLWYDWDVTRDCDDTPAHCVEMRQGPRFVMSERSAWLVLGSGKNGMDQMDGSWTDARK
jgi:hypothetical protein